MTLIVGIVDKNTKDIYMAGDSAATGEVVKSVVKYSKVFIRDKFIIGFCGSARMGQLLEHDERVNFRLQGSLETDMQYLVGSFIPAVQEMFRLGGFLRTNDEQQSLGGTFLIGYHGILYKIYDDFSIEYVFDDYLACGSGEYMALGSLYSTERTGGLDIPYRIQIAFEAAEKFTNCVAKPITIIKLEYNK